MAEITLERIQELRQRTGVGMMDCKKALTEANGDMEKALEILRKRGASIAANRADRATSEGLIHAYIHPGSRVGVLVEINCETDFVARTQDLKDFAQDLCLHITALKPAYVSSEEVEPSFIEKERAFAKEQLMASGKPAAIIENILEGKMSRLYSEVCLLNQPFVKNDKLTIADRVQELVAKLGEKIKIRRFVRYEIGS